MTEVYITQYATTKGIITKDLPVDGKRVKDRWVWRTIGRDCFLTMEEARADAEKRRAAQIASFKKSIAKLEKMAF